MWQGKPLSPASWEAQTEEVGQVQGQPQGELESFVGS